MLLPCKLLKRPALLSGLYVCINLYMFILHSGIMEEVPHVGYSSTNKASLYKVGVVGEKAGLMKNVFPHTAVSVRYPMI